MDVWLPAVLGMPPAALHRCPLAGGGGLSRRRAPRAVGPDGRRRRRRRASSTPHPLCRQGASIGGSRRHAGQTDARVLSASGAGAAAPSQARATAARCVDTPRGREIVCACVRERSCVCERVCDACESERSFEREGSCVCEREIVRERERERDRAIRRPPARARRPSERAQAKKHPGRGARRGTCAAARQSRRRRCSIYRLNKLPIR